MRLRPPPTILAYIAIIVVILVAGLVDAGLQPQWLFAAAILGAGAAGLYLGNPLVWVVVVVFHVVNLLVVVLEEPRWPTVAVLLVLLLLLLAPPSRRHVRRDPAQTPAARARRRASLAGAVIAGMLLGLATYSALLAPGPVSGDLELVRGDRPGLRVLFIGTTLTSDHAMPRTVSRLARSGPRAPEVFAVRYARRGSTLEDALEDERLTELLDGERWDYVVVQEHSQSVSRRAEHVAHTLPAAAAIGRMIRRSGAQAVLFANPGYEQGDRDEVPEDTFEAMGARLAQGHRELAAALPAVIAPVGAAWRQARRERPDLKLWSDDGIRPTRAASYLTACVLYAVLTQRDPSAARFDADLDPDEARELRRIAAEVVRRGA